MLLVGDSLSAKNGCSGLRWMLCLLALLFAAPVYSQSLGEIARQERERKQSHPRATHVYTNDDLARPRILLPGDRERVEAAQKKAPPAASESAPVVAGSERETEAPPLGDIARRYRALRQARQKLEPELKATQPEMGAPVLAYPTFPRPVVRTVPPLSPPGHFVRPRPRAEKATRGEEPFAGIRVQAGDTLWRLAREYLGRGAEWRLLAAVNSQVSDPTRLQIGSWIRLPGKIGALPPAGRVRVERGDSLSKLAQAQLGKSEAWSCIAQANPQIQNPDLIFPGQMVAVPASCAVTR